MTLSPFKKISLSVAMILIWGLVWIFAHDYVVKGVNGSNKNRLEKISEDGLHYRWSLADMDQLVKSFQEDWELSTQGITSTGKSPEISLELHGKMVYPKIHHSLSWDLNIKHQVQKHAKVKFEFSNQQDSVYYDSPELMLSEVQGGINFNEINWMVNNASNSKLAGEQINWQQIKAVDALVIRFYFAQPESFSIKDIVIKQSQSDALKPVTFTSCNKLNNSFLKCELTNAIRYLDTHYNKSEITSLIGFDAYFELSPVIWLVMSWLVCFGLVGLASKETRQWRVIILLTVVYAFIITMHWQSVIYYADYFRWPLMGLFLIIFWCFRREFIEYKGLAAPVWIVTLLFTGSMLAGIDVSYQFINQLPGYFIWAILQQLILGPMFSQYIYQRLELPKWLVALFVGVLFSIVHAPNQVLMLATMIGGVFWSYAWLKYQNIYANSFSHALLALVFYQVMPTIYLGSARIGAFF